MHANLVVARAAPQEAGTENVHRVARQDQLAVHAVVGVRQINRQQQIVLANRRAQKQRAAVIDQQPQSAQKTRPFVIDPLLSEPGMFNIAGAIENGKTLALLQNPNFVRGRRRRDNIIVISQTDNVIHFACSFAAAPYGGARAVFVWNRITNYLKPAIAWCAYTRFHL